MESSIVREVIGVDAMQFGGQSHARKKDDLVLSTRSTMSGEEAQIGRKTM